VLQKNSHTRFCSPTPLKQRVSGKKARFLKFRFITQTVIKTHLPGFELSKISGGVDICLFIVTVITHRQFSIINNGGGLKLTPPGYPRASCLGGGVEQTTGGGGSTPPTPRQFKHSPTSICKPKNFSGGFAPCTPKGGERTGGEGREGEGRGGEGREGEGRGGEGREVPSGMLVLPP
jgi:hypothetical protein